MSAQPLLFPIVTVMLKVVALKDHRFVFLTPMVIILRPWESRKDEDVVLVWALSAFLRYLSPSGLSPELVFQNVHVSGCVQVCLYILHAGGWSSTAVACQRYLKEGDTGQRRPLCLTLHL